MTTTVRGDLTRRHHMDADDSNDTLIRPKIHVSRLDGMSRHHCSLSTALLV
jgi:hypothetical protein